MRHPWPAVPFAASHTQRGANHRPRHERPAHHRPRVMLAAPATALTAWIGVITQRLPGGAP